MTAQITDEQREAALETIGREVVFGNSLGREII